MRRITAPWDAETIKKLNYQQGVGFVHPYTCGNCGADLVATELGWRCQSVWRGADCGYTQDWAHEPPTIEQLEMMNPQRYLGTKATP